MLGAGGDAAVEGIARAFNDPSALLKHELAYCLGQMRNQAAIPFLTAVLRDTLQVRSRSSLLLQCINFY